MSAPSAHKETTRTPGQLWRRNGLIWAALLVLMLTSFGAAYVPLGAFNTVVGIAIAAAKASLVALLFMELARAMPIVRLAALAGLLFLLVFFGLTMTDVITRALMGWRS